MSTRASAARYARALLDVAVKEANPEQIEQHLEALAALFSKTPDLQRALTHPAVPVSAKRGVVETLAGRLEWAPPLRKLLLLLADRDRLMLIPEVAQVYHERLMEHRKAITAELTTAAPIAPEQATAFQQRLSQATGRTVTLTTRVDPDIIGGAVTRIGTTVFDGSIASQLQQMRDRLQQQR